VTSADLDDDGPDLSGIDIPPGCRIGSAYEQLCAAWHREPCGDTKAAIGAAILALMSKARSWRPIATAPRNGREVLIRFGIDGRPSQAKYIEGLPYPWKYLDTNDGVQWLVNYTKDGPGGPSHWTSLTDHIVGETGDPLDMPLPCDVSIGAGKIRKGVALRILVLRAQGLHRMLMKHMPEPTPEQRAAFEAMFEHGAHCIDGDHVADKPETP
jgi:hypothetical protein